jgi:hypothetical protein
MELTPSLVEAKAREYRETEPLYAVERDHVEMLPRAFEGGEYGWRDVEWVVQWYFRRYLGAYPGDERRASEASFRENDFDDVADVLGAVVERRPVAERLDRLTTLVGVDVRVASAFLLFAFPGRYVVIGDREWRVLRDAGELERSYPDAPTVDDYLAYHDVCCGLAVRLDVDAWTLYRALWRLGDER